jgi:hypothetical protein
MHATGNVRHYHANRTDLQQLEGSSSDATAVPTADVVSVIAQILAKPHRFIALVGAILITFFLAWIFAHDTSGALPGPAQIAGPTDAGNDSPHAIV